MVFGSCYCHHSVQPPIYTLSKAYYQGKTYKRKCISIATTQVGVVMMFVSTSFHALPLMHFLSCPRSWRIWFDHQISDFLLRDVVQFPIGATEVSYFALVYTCFIKDALQSWPLIIIAIRCIYNREILNHECAYKYAEHVTHWPHPVESLPFAHIMLSIVYVHHKRKDHRTGN